MEGLPRRRLLERRAGGMILLPTASRMRSIMRFRFYLLGFLCVCKLAMGAPQREEQRITQLKDDVASLEAVIADKNSPASDRARLQIKLDRLKQELGILQEREKIE